MKSGRIFSQSEVEEFKTVLKNITNKILINYSQDEVNDFLNNLSESFEYRLYFRKIRNIDFDSSYFRNNADIHFDFNVCVIYSIYDGMLCQKYLIAVIDEGC